MVDRGIKNSGVAELADRTCCAARNSGSRRGFDCRMTRTFVGSWASISQDFGHTCDSPDRTDTGGVPGLDPPPCKLPPMGLLRVTGFPPTGGAPHTDSFQIKQQHCEVCRRDATDATRLSETGRPDAGQFFPCLHAKLGHRRVIEVVGDASALQSAKPLYFCGLAVDITAVLCLQHDLFDDARVSVPFPQWRVPLA